MSETLRKGDAEYVAPRVETNQIEELIDIVDLDSVRDAIDQFFNARRAKLAAAKQQSGGSLLLDDSKTEPNVYYGYREKGTKVKLSFVNMSEPEITAIRSAVVGLSGKIEG